MSVSKPPPPSGTKPKSTVRLLSGLASPSVVGSWPKPSVMAPLRTVPPLMKTPLSSLSVSLFGLPDDAMSVLDRTPAGGTTSTKNVPGSSPANR